MEKLGIEFSCISPDIDESPLAGEDPEQLVERLSVNKALKIVEQQLPESLIISSDQIALHHGNILGKPGTRENAIAQLSAFSDQAVNFITGLCVMHSQTKQHYYAVDHTQVIFKPLTTSLIERYVDQEQPLNCAGSFKSEGLGIVLFDKIINEDPSALVGLPLINLTKLLARFNYQIL